MEFIPESTGRAFGFLLRPPRSPAAAGFDFVSAPRIGFVGLFARFLLAVCVSSAAIPCAATASSARPSPRRPFFELLSTSLREPVGLERRTLLDAGGTVEVRWSRLPEAAEEVELLLSVDDGRTYPVRLTEELDPHGGSFLWEVPGLETTRGRLAIRMGLNGTEVIAAATEPFEISRRPSTAGVRLRWRSGEIWTASDSDAGASRPEPGESLGAALPGRMTAQPESADAIETPSPVVHRREGRRSTPVGFFSIGSRTRAWSERPPTSPRVIPKRI